MISGAKKIGLLSLTILVAGLLQAQLAGFSLATDLSLVHNFKKEQRFSTIGQTINTLYHLNARESFYVWFAYYKRGKFDNDLVANAKSTSTSPASIAYVNSARLRMKQVSIGYRNYLKGAFDAEKKWNLYVYGGFGVMLGSVENTHSVIIDTALYAVPVRSGKANFKRLTVDLGSGVEVPIGGDFYVYSELRVWVPTTDYPSKFLFVNKDAPFAAMLSAGLRISF